MLYIIKTSRIQDVLSKKLRIVKNILGRGGRGAWRSPPAEIGELPKHRKQRVSTVQPLAGWPTGRGVLIYCLNRSGGTILSESGICSVHGALLLSRSAY